MIKIWAIKNDAQYRYLVVGSTGILAPLCQSLKPQEVMIAARFLSHPRVVKVLQKKLYVRAVGLLLR